MATGSRKSSLASARIRWLILNRSPASSRGVLAYEIFTKLISRCGSDSRSRVSYPSSFTARQAILMATSAS
ncbi:MAG: hypothetical protein VB877_15650, partial [Pirellulaceae bacterium]